MIKKTKEQKGITLVALVITIIILLILAGVALSIVFNGGIIDKSQNAVDSYNYSSKNEEEKLSDLEAKFTQLYNERVAGKEGNLEEGGSEDGSEEGTGGGSGTIGTLASKVKVGDYIEYDPTAGVTDTSLLSYTSPIGTLVVLDPNSTAEDKAVLREEGSTYTYNGAYNLLNANGEFVLPEGYEYENYGTDSEKSGQDKNESGNGDSNQSFQATASNNVWRVLDVNTTTGVVKIIPENEIKTTANANFYMRGLRGYKNAVTELNNISEIFGHGTGANGAKSIIVEEVNALTGYTPAEATSVQVGSIGTWNNTWYGYLGTTYPGTSGQNSNGIDNAKIYEMLIKRGNTENRSYWIASFCVRTSDASAPFLVRGVGSGNVNCSGYLWTVGSGGYELDQNTAGGVLPVVSLQSSVNYKSGDGTSSASDKIIKFQ